MAEHPNGLFKTGHVAAVLEQSGELPLINTAPIMRRQESCPISVRSHLRQ